MSDTASGDDRMQIVPTWGRRRPDSPLTVSLWYSILALAGVLGVLSQASEDVQ